MINVFTMYSNVHCLINSAQHTVYNKRTEMYRLWYMYSNVQFMVTVNMFQVMIMYSNVQIMINEQQCTVYDKCTVYDRCTAIQCFDKCTAIYCTVYETTHSIYYHKYVLQITQPCQDRCYAITV